MNMRSVKGQLLLEEILKTCDVLVHNFPLGTMEADLLDYEKLGKKFPELIVVAISGFGQNGPYAKKLCFDSIAQAMCGSMSFSGYPGTPPLKSGVPFVDFNTAARAAFGSMLALYERKASGKGQLVDIALFDVALSIVGSMGCAAEYRLLGEIRKQAGNCGFYAYVGSCQTKDGYISINIIGNNQWRKMCRLMKKEELISDPRFKDNLNRFRNYPAIDAIFEEWTKDKTIIEAMGILEEAGVPCGPVNDVPAAFSVPQVAAREMLVDIEYPGVGKVPVPGISVKLSRTPGKVAKRASFLGEDNEEIYCRLLGYKLEDLEKFKQENTI